MGRGLKAAGVVASVDAFIEAAGANPEAGTIQAGFYPLLKEMKASDVVAILVDPDNIVTTNVTIPEGLRVKDIVDLLVESTGFPKADFEKALQDPEALGLPAYAEGNPEGYLFPATYSFGPEEKPADMLHDMVVRWQQAATENDLEAGAEALGYTPQEIMTIASLIEAEGRGQVPRQDRPGHLQPAGDRPQPGAPASCRSTRASTTRSTAPAPPSSPTRTRTRWPTRRTTPTRRRGCRRRRSRRPATTRSRRRCIPRTARGSST